MNMSEKDVEVVLSLLRRIKIEARNPKKYKIENLCSKAIVTINKAKRRNGKSKTSETENLRAAQ